ncbi:LysR family transcriptional regulator [Paractinoplanes abujensis]|uniref:DNA-binding transcriptional LysR family regulator n=1 Tax=Paractinoplanes abujensis TaxID=882441 RepID=A0A7W7CSH5_9ACTN|nr:LysR family transcriptional regulator [Actinoplanes abujensis]MBB4693901.1 DNA-binding transcriptional LysR family regulator [Actinoplanes abujensis]GID21443.1 LysR family transcriptional regulator [Actinoplanes abujensis]
MQLDLNLLTALHALLEENSVTGAADRLRLSVPAVSRTLGRIRRLTGDDILVRTGHTMTPTPYAVGIRDRVGEVLQQARSVLTPSRDLEPATLERTFTLQCHDALATALAPPLLTALATRAPGVTVRLLAEATGDSDDLRHGHVDLQLGATLPDRPEFRSATLGHDRLVIARRRHTPKIKTLPTYAARPHIVLSRRGRLTDPVDDHLATHGLHRHVRAAVATAATALHIVATGDAVVTVPEASCRPLTDAFGLSVDEFPAPLPHPPIISVWHQRYDTDPAHAWLRAQVRAAVTAALPARGETHSLPAAVPARRGSASRSGPST